MSIYYKVKVLSSFFRKNYTKLGSFVYIYIYIYIRPWTLVYEYAFVKAQKLRTLKLQLSDK